MLAKYFSILCLLGVVEAVVNVPPNFRIRRREWPQFVNQPKLIVQKEISRIFPYVPFKIVDVETDNRNKEEFYFDRIKLVVDKNNIVVRTPKLFGVEPDLSQLFVLLGKDWNSMKQGIITKFPGFKIIARRGGKVLDIYETGDHRNYFLLEVEPNFTVRLLPYYVRVSDFERKK